MQFFKEDCRQVLALSYVRIYVLVKALLQLYYGDYWRNLYVYECERCSLLLYYQGFIQDLLLEGEHRRECQIIAKYTTLKDSIFSISQS